MAFLTVVIRVKVYGFKDWCSWFGDTFRICDKRNEAVRDRTALTDDKHGGFSVLRFSIYIMLTWGLSSCQIWLSIFLSAIFPQQSSVTVNCGYISLYSPRYTHTHSFHSVPSWPPGSAGEATCGGRELTPSDRFFRQSSGPSTADSIIQSQVPLSGSMGLGDIIVTLPSSPSVSNGGVELVKGPCE